MEKRKFFYLYYNQKIGLFKEDNHSDFDLYVNENNIDRIIKLRLKSMNDLSKDDAKSFINGKIGLFDGTTEIINTDMTLNILHIQYRNEKYNDDIQDFFLPLIMLQQRDVDFFRLKGYLLPFQDCSCELLIEKGLVKLDT